MVDRVRKDNYNSEFMLNTIYGFSRYLQRYSRAFYVYPEEDRFLASHKKRFKICKVKTDSIFTRQLTKDIDDMLHEEHKKTEKAIITMRTLVMASNELLDQNLYDKLMRETLYQPRTKELIESKKIPMHMVLDLVKICRFL